MKSTIWSSVIATTVLATLVIPVQPAAQDKKDPHHKHHHYQLVDMGTFGGPQSYLNDGGGITAVADVNNRGTLAGTADTSTPDPYPDFCFNEDCFVSHAFRGRNHHKIDLGVLPGGGSSASTWISANGLIVGLSQNGEIDPLIEGLPETRAVLWQNGGITDLGILPEGGYESVANAVNNHGQVAGAALNTIADSNSMFGLGYQARAFFWEDGVMRDLGTLGTGTDAQAILINDRGQVVGLSYTSSDQSAICAAVFAFPLTTSSFLWEKGKKMVDIGGLGGTCTVAFGLNNRGQVVGWASLPGDQGPHPFRWDREKGGTDLGTLGGHSASAYAINDQGEAVGGSAKRGDILIHAALWGRNGKTDLGVVGGDTCSYALSINRSRQVVGISGTDNCASTRAFLWEHGHRMVDLNALLSSKSGLYVDSAFTINDRGEIAAEGVLPDGNEHAVLLIPCDENHPAVEGCDYSSVDATRVLPESAAPVIRKPVTTAPRTN